MTTVTCRTVEIVETLLRPEGRQDAMIDGEWQAMTTNVLRHHDKALRYIAMSQPDDGGISPLIPGFFCKIERFCAI
ncbi:MAG: hypothetical protein J7463_06320 [Roseiflexus sp.]|jgi:hypothetical protein|nr:hypothetical protein [Roseiflexus sp.]MBO9334900.1 hypothetical protein [Roseiflexus sp.]MBO9341052.1 hypothetical protein [Roseiflexus sp.]MBO9364674.1 hypothetical protein [Roseiflexus sp.]MBO9383855.1 hypothetical protein [Roseiflexus sp.]